MSPLHSPNRSQSTQMATNWLTRHQFRNSYEWSKALSEEAARMTLGHVNIVRLPLVVGRRYDGAIARFNGLYTLLRSLQTGLAPAVIGHPDAIVEIAPADEAAEAVWSQIAEPTRSRTVVTSGGALTLGELVRAVYSALNHWRSRRQLGHLPGTAARLSRELAKVPVPIRQGTPHGTTTARP